MKRMMSAKICLTGVMTAALLFSSSFLFAGGGPNVNGAKLYIQQNELDRAVEVLLKEVNEVDPNNEDAWYLLGYIYARQQKYDKMMEAFDKAVELKPEFKEKGIKVSKDSGKQFHSEFGTELIKKIIWGNVFNQGVKKFNDAVNAASDSAKTQHFEAAIENFEKATEIMPDSTLAYRNMAAALLNIGKLEESVAPLKKALENNPEDTEVKTMLAQVYMNSGQDSLAVPILEDLWESGVHTEEVSDNLSRAYIRSGEIDKAKNIYQQAIQNTPDNFYLRYNYGTILLEANEFDAAIEQLQKAYEIDSSSTDINYNLGAAYLNRGIARRDSLPEDSQETAFLEDFKKALPFLIKSVKMNPDDEQTWFTLGRIAGQLNKMSLAGYAFAKGEPEKSALDGNVRVGMPASSLTAILGEPDKVSEVESVQFPNVEEWIYQNRKAADGKVAITEPINIYVADGRVEAVMVMK